MHATPDVAQFNNAQHNQQKSSVQVPLDIEALSLELFPLSYYYRLLCFVLSFAHIPIMLQMLQHGSFLQPQLGKPQRTHAMSGSVFLSQARLGKAIWIQARAGPGFVFRTRTVLWGIRPRDFRHRPGREIQACAMLQLPLKRNLLQVKLPCPKW